MKKNIHIFLFGMAALLFADRASAASVFPVRAAQTSCRYEKTTAAQSKFAAKKDDKKKGKKGARKGVSPDAKGTSSYSGTEAGLHSSGITLVRCLGEGSYWSVCIMDASSGQMLLNEHATEKTYLGDGTRLMMLLLLAEQMERGRLKPEQELEISEESAMHLGSNEFVLPAGTKVVLGDAMKLLAMRPCTQMQYTLATLLGKDEKEVVSKMNARARQLGMAKTKFTDFSGLDGVHTLRADAIGTTSARDMALLAREVLRHPIAKNLASMKEWKTAFGMGRMRLLRNVYNNPDLKLPMPPDCTGLWSNGDRHPFGGTSGLYFYERGGKTYIVSMRGCNSRRELFPWMSFLMDRIAPPSDGSPRTAQPKYWERVKK